MRMFDELLRNMLTQNKTIKHLILLLTVVCCTTSMSTAYAQSEAIEMLELVAHQHLLSPIDAEILSEEKFEITSGVDGVMLIAQRDTKFSNSYIKTRYNEFLNKPGHFGPESGFGANSKVLVDWRPVESEDLKDMYDIYTLWEMYEHSIYEIYLSTDLITIIIYDKYW